MKKTRKKILTAVITLIVALGLSIGTVFAWFTSNRTVTFEAIDAQVTTGSQGLFVALKKYDGTYTQFKTSLTAAELQEAIFGGTSAANLATVKLDHMTTENNGVTLKGQDGSTVPAFNTDATTTEGKNGYVQFTLKFRTTIAQNIYLAGGKTGGVVDAGSSTITPGAGVTLQPVLAWKTESANVYGTAITQGQAINARAAHAARVAFISGATGKIWAPYDQADTSPVHDGVHDQAGYYLGNLAGDYYNNFIGNGSAPAVAKTSVVNSVVMLSDANMTANNPGTATVIATTSSVSGNFEAEVTVKLWIEGTDGDCLNSIFDDKISLLLSFNSISIV